MGFGDKMLFSRESVFSVRFGLGQRGFVRGDDWNFEGALPQSLWGRGGRVFMNSANNGVWNLIRFAGLGAVGEPTDCEDSWHYFGEVWGIKEF